jgi:hypothetical protein
MQQAGNLTTDRDLLGSLGTQECNRWILIKKRQSAHRPVLVLFVIRRVWWFDQENKSVEEQGSCGSGHLLSVCPDEPPSWP